MAATSSELNLVIKARNLAGRQLRSVGSDLDRVNRKTGALRSKFLKFGKIVTRSLLAVGLAVGAAVFKSIGAFASFDQKLNQSVAIMGDVSDEMRKKMSDAAREIGRTTLIGADEAAEAYFFLASAGFDAEQSIKALPQVAAFAQAGMFDMSTATDLATDAQSALGLTSKDSVKNLEGLTRVTDVLVKANTLANASVEQFSTSLTNKAGTALKLVGKDIEEGAAVLAVFADKGVKGQVAGEQLSRLLKGLQVNANTNAGAFKKMGINVFDSSGHMNNIGEIIGDVSQAFEGLSHQQAIQALLDLGFNERQQDVIKMLIGTEDQLVSYEAALRDAGGTSQEVADKQLKPLIAKWKVFKGKVNDLAIALGEKLEPKLVKVVDKLTEWADEHGPAVNQSIEDFIEAVEGFATTLEEKVSGAIETVVGWWDKLDPRVQNAIKFGLKLRSMVWALSLAFGLLVTILAVLFSKVLLISLAIVAIGAGFKYAYDNVEWFRDAVDGVIDWLQNDAVSAWEGIWASISEVAGKAWEVLQIGIGIFVEFFQGVWDRFGGRIIESGSAIWDIISHIWDTAFATVQNAISVFVGTATWIWENFGNEIIRLFSYAWDFIVTLIDGIVSIITGIIQVFAGVFTGDWQQLWDGIKNIATGAWNIFVGFITLAIENFRLAWDTVWKIVSSAFGAVWDVISSVAETGWNAFMDFLNPVIDAFKIAWDIAWESIKTAFAFVWNTIATVASTAWSAFLTIINPVIEAFKIAWNTTWNAIKKVFKVAWNTLKKVAKVAWNAFKIVLNPVINAFKKAWNTTWNAIKKVFKVAWNTLKKVAKVAWDILVKWATPVINTFKKAWNTTWNAIKKVFSKVWNALKKVANTAWRAFKTWIGGAWTKFKGWWSTKWETLKSAISKAFNGVSGVISGVLNGILGTIETSINTAIGLINKLIRVYNKIPLAPDIPEIGTVSIGRLAKGTTRVMEQGLAIVGERGPEALELPIGARVSPIRPQPVLGGSGGRGGHRPMKIEMHFHGVDLADPQAARRTVEELRRRLRELEQENL